MSDAWLALRRFTQARIGLGRAGHAVSTRAQLDFQLAHAQARDAVRLPWNTEDFANQVRGLGEEVLVLATPVCDRDEYLRRPDLGRRLDGASRARLESPDTAQAEVALIITNGLSTTAVEQHGIPLLRAIRTALAGHSLCIAVVANGRVALSDDIGQALAARVAVMIVGERPGLSATDSLGIYLTYAPGPGRTDADRNCISNIRPPEGLGHEAAATRLLYLTEEALRRGLSGVALKDESLGLERLEGT